MSKKEITESLKENPAKNKDIHDLLTRSVVDATFEGLKKRIESGHPLRIKLGIDPTGSRLHIGRAVPLRKLRKFQELGHKIVLIIGDFTGLVGDASDKNAERPMLDRRQVESNMKNYVNQLGLVIDIDKCELRYNSEWLAPLDFYDIAKLAQNFSAAEMLDRDNFSKRFKAGKRISLHEFLYPLMQGYDSVEIKSDVEIGGTDQWFNLLAGRTLQRSAKQKPQEVMTLDLLEGTDGRKMSTSWGNTIYLDEKPNEMFGKIMSIPDTLIVKYFELCTDEDLNEMKKLTKKNPRDAKVHLAKTIIEFYHDKASADSAEQDFITKFVKKEVPDEMPEFKVGKSEIGILELITDVTKFSPSKSEARRLVQQGGVTFDDKKIDDPNATVKIAGGEVLKVGKRKFGKITK
jgi:tyrosyl-tRNA synthetase